MSIWADIHKRSNGKQLRKEDTADLHRDVVRIPKMWKDLLQDNKILYEHVSDLLKEIEKYRWRNSDMKNEYCNTYFK